MTFGLLRSFSFCTLIMIAFTACAKAPEKASGLRHESHVIDSRDSHDSRPYRHSRDARIIGGAEATGEEAFSKTIVSLMNVRKASLCTASIYSDSLLVTAAHCLNGSAARDLRVVFGKSMDSQDLVIRAADAFVVAPSWTLRQRQLTDTGDIALVHFRGGLAPGYKPAKILTDASALKIDQPVTLAGYGTSDGVSKTGDGRLRFVETMISNTTFSSTEVLVDQSHGKGACHGDSGGPAYVKIDGQLYLWGITSRGVNDINDDCSVSSAYTVVPSYLKWLERTASLMAPLARESSI
jgi:secreted trypsin-like serine protease